MSLLQSMNPCLPVLARAIVTSNNDPDHQGRVRLEYPWLGKSSAAHPSEWARVSSPFASRDCGWWMLPEVGDEVLVFFDNGDLESPIVMGSLYGHKNQAPSIDKSGDFNQDNKNSLRFLKTKAGHVIAFDDSDGKESIEITHKSGTKLSLSEKKVVIHAASTIELGEGASEALIKGKSFLQFFNTHVHATPVGTSSPPSVPMQPMLLSERVKTS